MWKKILENPTDYRYQHTLKEIMQQPEIWKKIAPLILENTELENFFNQAINDKNRPIIVAGAGSSEFIGKSMIDTLSKFTNRRVISAPTTDIVTHPKKYKIPNEPALMITFARSGDSPESFASIRLMKYHCPDTKHLIITCSKDGHLTQFKDPNVFCLVLPKEINDKSAVMTSSFSSMMLAGVLCGTISQKERAYNSVEAASACAASIFNKQVTMIDELMQCSDIDRIQFIGSSDAHGLLSEAAFKMLEVTDGKIATQVDTFLGLRHGSQVFITHNTVVIAILSKDPDVRQYELDMLKELKYQRQGFAYIIIGKNADEVEMPNMIVCYTGDQSNFFKLLPALVMCQLVAFFKSIHLGISPDSPSSSKVINRVVKGVKIYS